jgi:hypothetical protein
VSPVKYELGSHIPEDAILHSHRRENLKFLGYLLIFCLIFGKGTRRSVVVKALCYKLEGRGFETR